jgi:IS605 OrfB family transposase
MACESHNAFMPDFIRTLRLKVCPESYPWLNAAAVEVNQVWNYNNQTSWETARRTDRKRKWLSGFDLCGLTAGAATYFERIGADTIQRICIEYAQKRAAAKRIKLRWRVSRGSRRSLGWVPLKAASLKRKGRALRFCGKTFRVFESQRLNDVRWGQGCFAQDAVGDWWLCLPVEQKLEPCASPEESVGIDLGLKSVAVCSEGERLDVGRFYRDLESKIAQAQRRGHKRHAKRLHRRAARRRADALHKFTRTIVDRYEYIVVGDVSSQKLVRTPMAKSVLDSAWGMLKRMLHCKGQSAGRSVEVINERNTTRACSFCGAFTGPTGASMLAVRQWGCSECGAEHDRDVNAARNILFAGLRCRASVRGNELSQDMIPIEQDTPVLARYGWGACHVAA